MNLVNGRIDFVHLVNGFLNPLLGVVVGWSGVFLGVAGLGVEG